MAKYLSRLIYFHEPEAAKIKPESEISYLITLTCVISGLFTLDTFTAVVSTRGLVTHSSKLIVGVTHTPS